MLWRIHEFSNIAISRVIVWLLLVSLLAYDVPMGLAGRTTISEALRQIDQQTNGLVRWGFLALWCHLFVKPW